jgi:uncharacterized LabA/DUF88 family protein
MRNVPAALIIDAMDLLHSKNVDGFCLVSSDSDFTRLATRIREAGLIVYGFGEEKTPEAFRAACNKFVFVEILKQTSAIAEAEPAKPTVSVPKLPPLLTKVVEATAKQDGWAPLSTLGSTLQKTDSSFDPRNYGFKKLSDSCPEAELSGGQRAERREGCGDGAFVCEVEVVVMAMISDVRLRPIVLKKSKSSDQMSGQSADTRCIKHVTLRARLDSLCIALQRLSN